ncbi:MAG: TPM domain-containing protein [Mangrovibacterium sp.]
MKQLFFLLAFWLGLTASAQDIPQRPQPPRLVNDFAGVLSQAEVNQLESELVNFNNRTTTQIVVVTVPDLNGYDAADFAVRLGEQWGVGQKGSNNGVVVLFKPKTAESNGKIYVAVGYGLEGIIPDAVANRDIIDYEMIPRFKQGDIYGGLHQGVKVIMGLASKEFTAKDYQKKVNNAGAPAIGIIFFVGIIILILSLFRRKNSYYTSGSNLPFWLLMGSMMNSGTRNGSWGNFSGGSGGFGGGGGFGGFGGGSFGGGGAGGSW